jgi:hypothetical protein
MVSSVPVAGLLCFLREGGLGEGEAGERLVHIGERDLASLPNWNWMHACRR